MSCEERTKQQSEPTDFAGSPCAAMMEKMMAQPGKGCPCAQLCPKKSLLLAIVAVPLAFWALRRLRK
jgi:hypothetical protein